MKTDLKAICVLYERILRIRPFFGTLSVGRKEFTNIPLDAKPFIVYNNSRL